MTPQEREDKLREAAEQRYPMPNRGRIYDIEDVHYAFMIGAKSEAAREYHLPELSRDLYNKWCDFMLPCAPGLHEAIWNFFLPYLQKPLESEAWIPVSERLPELGGLYLVTQNLEDGYPPLTWALVYDQNEKKWFIDDSEKEEINIIAWRDLPKPMQFYKKPIPIVHDPISLDEYERTVYGQCVHGENIANCDVCNSTTNTNKVN